MKRLFAVMIAALISGCSICADIYAQGGSTLVLDEASFAPVNVDALTGVNIDPIGKDRSNRECARVKIHVTRMSPSDVAGISVRTVGGNILVMKQTVAAGGNGIIVEMTARPDTRFYLHHDVFGESNVASVDLAGNKEYTIEAWCNLSQTITVACDRIGAGVFLDGRLVGQIGGQGVLVIPDVQTGPHQLNVADANDDASLLINVSRSEVYFNVVLQDSASLQQFVLFNVDPKDATVELAGSVLPVSDGTASKMMNFGTYTYKVYAPRYHTEEGTVTVNSMDRRAEVNVKLRPAVGILEIMDNPSLNGADVYVDDEFIGKAPLTTTQISSGSHKIRFVKPMYEPYEQYLTLYDGKTLVISPELVADFVMATLRTVPGGEIWVNGTYKGMETWTGELSKGACRFEVRKEGHRTAYLSRNIEATGSPVTIDLPAPEAVYGRLVINSTPAKAVVEISGMSPMETPVVISKMLTGSHEVRITKPGYQDYVTTVTVSEGKSAEINAVLKSGSTPKKSTKKLSDYIDKARKGDASAQFEVGYCYYNGLGTEVNYEKAVEWYLKSAAQNNSAACNNLGFCYERGDGVPKSISEAFRYYKTAADLGDEVGQCNLAWCYENGKGTSKDLDQAAYWYRKSAEQGWPRAQYNLGHCYEFGRGVTKNIDEAVKWYRKAADQGYASAQCNLGVCYELGSGVVKDMYEAASLYRKAADQGHARAQCNLGYCYAKGEGVQKDLYEAFKWIKKAADQDNARALNKLGLMYENGEGVGKDYYEAVKWFRRAADLNSEYAQYNLARCYEYGYGVPASRSEARKWYQKAADNGHSASKEKLLKF